MKNSIYFPILDNGMGLCRAKTAGAMFNAALCGVFAGRKITWVNISSPYPGAIMNIAANQFLASGCDEMICHDLDIVYTAQQMAWLLDHDVEFVGGIVPKRVLGLELAIYPYEPLAENPFADGVKPLVDAAFGRGFMRVHRTVFEKLKEHVPTYSDEMEVGGNGAERFEFFRYKPGGHSEDFALCEDYRKIGGKTWVDQRIVTRHIGEAEYPIQGTF